jgi:heme-degrading monooxygenase HmoA
MSQTEHSDTAQHVYRVDRFVVPAAAREEFLERVRQTHQVLRRQPGFVRDAVLEQEAGAGTSSIVTIAEWESEAAITGARAAVAALHAETRFSPQETLARLGIKAEIGIYRPVA